MMTCQVPGVHLVFAFIELFFLLKKWIGLVYLKAYAGHSLFYMAKIIHTFKSHPILYTNKGAGWEFWFTPKQMSNYTLNYTYIKVPNKHNLNTKHCFCFCFVFPEKLRAKLFRQVLKLITKIYHILRWSYSQPSINLKCLTCLIFIISLC